jgi:riboflavin synthase
LSGDSIAINGVCLTILEPTTTDTAVFFVMEETRRKTNLTEITQDTPVNVEHALRVGDSMGGHTVSGHVDGTATVVSVTDRPDGSRDVWIELSSFDPESVYVVYKGSVCLDGS